MEPVGFAIGVASLASLFETAVDGFRYVRAGKEYGLDFQTSCLQLDNAQLRLTRWGEAVGLGSHPATASSLQTITDSQEDARRAEAILGQIIALFQRAEEVTNTFRARHGSHTEVELETVLSPENRTLRERMLEICRQRQRSTGVLKKAKWAIYERDHFRSLVADVDAMVHNLVDLFPGTQAAQRELCDREVARLGDVSDLPTLKAIANAHDKRLADALARQDRQGTITQNWINADGTKVINQGNQNIYGNQTITL